MHQNYNCVHGTDLFITTGGTTEEIEACKELSARNQQYAAFVVAYGKCFFKPSQCMENLSSDPAAVTYLKETVDE